MDSKAVQQYVSSSMNTLITNWLKQNVNPTGGAVIIDNSFSVSGAAADAKLTGNIIASLYLQTPYHKGDKVLYNGVLYTCIENILTGESFNNEHWKKDTLVTNQINNNNDINNIKNFLHSSNNNININLIWKPGGLGSQDGVEYSNTNNKTIITDYIDISNIPSFEVKNPSFNPKLISEWGMWFYDEHKVGKHRRNMDQSYNKYVNNYKYKYVRFYMANWLDNNVPVYPANGQNIIVTVQYCDINNEKVLLDSIGQNFSIGDQKYIHITNKVKNTLIKAEINENQQGNFVVAGKNLVIPLTNAFNSYQLNGLTCVTNANDYTMSISGIASEDTDIWLGQVITPPHTTIYFGNTAPSGSSRDTYGLWLGGYGYAYSEQSRDSANGLSTHIYAHIKAGIVLNNVKFKPQVTIEKIGSDEYFIPHSTFVTLGANQKIAYDYFEEEECYIYFQFPKWQTVSSLINIKVLTQNIPQKFDNKIKQIYDDINYFNDNRLGLYSNTQIFNNARLFECPYLQVPIVKNKKYNIKLLNSDINLVKPRRYYTLYCGKMIGKPDTQFRLYIQYNDQTVQRHSLQLSSNKNYYTFSTLYKNIKALQLLCIANDMQLYNEDGVAKFFDLVLLDGFLQIKPEFKNDEYIPSYYTQYLLDKEKIIRDHEKECGMNDSFIFITDTHYKAEYLTDNIILQNNFSNACHSIPLMKHVYQHTGINSILFGGDLLGAAPNGVDQMMQSMIAFRQKIEQFCPSLIPAIGNHEFYTDLDHQENGRPTAEELYSSTIKRNEFFIEVGPDCTYILDNKIHKIRYLCVSCGRDCELKQPAIEWALDMLSKTPDDYKIITFGHCLLYDTCLKPMGQHEQILDALIAIKEKQSFTYNQIQYHYENLHDVSVICGFTGHSHMDASLLYNDKFLCICTTCDCWAGEGTVQQGKWVKKPRNFGAVNEQAFDVVQFDFDKKKIYLTRIGAGQNREFSYD